MSQPYDQPASWRMRSRRTRLVLVALLLIANVSLAAGNGFGQDPEGKPPAYAVLTQQATQWVSEARAILARVPAETENAEKGRLEARALFQKAHAALDQALRDVQRALAGEADLQSRQALLQIQLLRPAVTKEMTATHGPNDPARPMLWRQAADGFLQVARDHRTRVAGMYARLYAGDCYMELGEPAKALEQYQFITDLPDKPAQLAALKKLVVWRAMCCLLKQDPPRFDRAIEIGSRWLRGANELDDSDYDKIAAHYFLAHSYLLRAEKATDAETQTAALRFAAANAHWAAKHGNERASEAKQLLQRLPPSLAAEAARQNGPLLEESEGENTKFEIRNSK